MKLNNNQYGNILVKWNNSNILMVVSNTSSNIHANEQSANSNTDKRKNIYFQRLTGEWSKIGELGEEAVKYVDHDPDAALLKLRIFAEKLTDMIICKEDMEMIALDTDKQADKLIEFEKFEILPAKELEKLNNIRVAGNKAAHGGKSTIQEANELLEQASELAKWVAEHYIEVDSIPNKKYHFRCMTGKWSKIGKIGEEAVKYVDHDPSLALAKLRIFVEKLTDEILYREEYYFLENYKLVDKIRHLEEDEIFPKRIMKKFHSIRLAGNKASHGEKVTTKEASKQVWQAVYLAHWVTKYYEIEDEKRRIEEEQYTYHSDGRLRYWFEDWIEDFLDWLKYKFNLSRYSIRTFWQTCLILFLVFHGFPAIVRFLIFGFDINSIIDLLIITITLKLLKLKFRTIAILLAILCGIQFFV